MSKTYILFTEEELDNLRDGMELKCTDARGSTLYIMLEKYFYSADCRCKKDPSISFLQIKTIVT